MSIEALINSMLKKSGLSYAQKENIALFDVVSYHRTHDRDWVALSSGEEFECNFRESDTSPSPGDIFWLDTEDKDEYGFITSRNFEMIFKRVEP